MSIRRASLIACLIAAGCGRGDVPKPRPIPVTMDVAALVRGSLEGYSRGQPVGSEREVFDTWIAEMRASDASGAELLAAGLREIAASPARAKTVATRLLAKLPAGGSAEQPAESGSARP